VSDEAETPGRQGEIAVYETTSASPSQTPILRPKPITNKLSHQHDQLYTALIKIILKKNLKKKGFTVFWSYESPSKQREQAT